MVIIFIILIVIAIVYFYYRRKLAQTEIDFTAVSISEFTWNKIKGKGTIILTNPAGLTGTITNLNCSLYIDGKFIGLFNQLDPEISVSDGKVYAKLNFELSPKKILDFQTVFGSIQNMIKNQNKWKIKGSAKVQKGLITVNIPFEYEDTFQ
jgi:hypothetical protein